MELSSTALVAVVGICFFAGIFSLFIGLRRRPRDRAHLEELVAKRTGALRTLSRAIEQSPSTVVITDPEGAITYANPSFTHLTGYTLDEVLGQDPGLLQSGEHSTEFYQELWRALLASDEWRGQFCNRKKDGECYWESATIAAVRDSAGALTGYVKVAEDITERKQAEEALQRRVEELATLNRVAQTVSTLTDLPAALESVAETVTEVLDASAAVISVVQGQEMEVLVWYERQPVAPGVMGQHFPLASGVPGMHQVLSRGETLVVPDVQAKVQSPIYQEHMQAHGLHTVMIVPLLVRGTVMGLLGVGADRADRVFTPVEISLAETIAADIAAAIENARLLEQSQAAAVDQERQRLARDLHDAVTQTIYSASLIAEALPRIWERDPEAAKSNLVKLRQLVRGALAEMRTLLFELRPAALEEASLDTLLHQLADAMTGRTRIPVDVRLQDAGSPPGEPAAGMPPDVKIALYRITQEAFNNVAKHAGATQLVVALQRTPDRVILTIHDDGRGFDPGAVSRDRLGMGIMAERAESVGARLDIESKLGGGTRLSVTWPGQGD